MNHRERQSLPPADQGDERDDKGRFLPAHPVGAATRFQPGQSGNPQGRPPFGASVREHINNMASWSRAELQAVIDDDNAPSAQAAAAQQVLKARNGEGAAFDRCADRTEGKPRQAIDVAAVASRPPAENEQVYSIVVSGSHDELHMKACLSFGRCEFMRMSRGCRET